MKNLLKSVMLVLLIVSFIGCESEPINTFENQSRLNFADSPNVPLEPCENLQSFAKFANFGNQITDFILFDSAGDILIREYLSPFQSTDLLRISSSDEKLTVQIRNSGNSFRKTIGVQTCMIYTFMIDENNTVIIDKFEL